MKQITNIFDLARVSKWGGFHTKLYKFKKKTQYKLTKRKYVQKLIGINKLRSLRINYCWGWEFSKVNTSLYTSNFM